jgi:hypothetical protein
MGLYINIQIRSAVRTKLSPGSENKPCIKIGNYFWTREREKKSTAGSACARRVCEPDHVRTIHLILLQFVSNVAAAIGSQQQEI